MNKDQSLHPVTRYAMIDASQAEALAAVVAVVLNWNKQVRYGVCLGQYGESPVCFLEVMRKDGPIVQAIKHQAEAHGLYPAYVVQEDKDHLPKQSTGTRWYVVDEVRYDLLGMTEEKFSQWKADYISLCKRIYREEHVFVKSFAYLGKGGVLHVMTFNTDRDPMSRGREIGVAEWNDAVDLLIKNMQTEYAYEPVNMRKQAVRYTNL